MVPVCAACSYVCAVSLIIVLYGWWFEKCVVSVKNMNEMRVRTDIEVIFHFFGLVLISLILLASLFLLIVSYVYAGKIFKYMSNSPAVIARKSTLGWEPIGRLLFISNVGAVLIFKRKSVGNGELCIKDYDYFPVGLRRVIECSLWMMLVLTAVAIIGVSVGKFNGWLR